MFMKEINQSFLEMRHMIITRETEITRLKTEQQNQLQQNQNEHVEFQSQLAEETARKNRLKSYVDKMAEKHSESLERKVCSVYFSLL